MPWEGRICSSDSDPTRNVVYKDSCWLRAGKEQPRELACPQAALFRQAFSALPRGAYLGPCPALGSPAWEDATRGVRKDRKDLKDPNGNLLGERAPNGIHKVANGAAAEPAVPAVSLEVDRFRRPFLTQVII